MTADPMLDDVAAVLETDALRELLAELNRADLRSADARAVRAALVRELTKREGGA